MAAVGINIVDNFDPIIKDVRTLNSDIESFMQNCKEKNYCCKSCCGFREYKERFEGIENQLGLSHKQYSDFQLSSPRIPDFLTRDLAAVRDRIDALDRRMRNVRGRCFTNWAHGANKNSREWVHRIVEKSKNRCLAVFSTAIQPFKAGFERFTAGNRVVTRAILSRIFPKPNRTRTGLIPLATTLGVGAVISPSFRTGTIVSMLEMFCLMSIMALLSKITKKVPNPFLKENHKSSHLVSHYEKKLNSLHFFHQGITGPLLEELEFRGILQNAISLVGGGSHLAIIVAGILFGLVHSTNDHKGVGLQVAWTAFSGMIMGLLNDKYGILAAIGNHMMWNSMLCFYEVCNPPILPLGAP